MIAGQVGLVPATPNWGSYVVVWATGSAYTHMVVAVSETHCVSAEPGGARLRPISDYPDTIWSRFELTPRQRHAIVRYANSKIDTPYGWIEYLATGLALVTKRATPNWLRRFIGREDRLICSQLSYLALKAGGVNPDMGRRPTLAVIPGDFGRYYVQQGWATEP